MADSRGDSLLDLVDTLIGKGVMLHGDVALSLANVDLVHARLSLLLGAADRVSPGHRNLSRTVPVACPRGHAPAPRKPPRESLPAHWNGEPDDAHRSVIRLVLTLVEFIRQLLERQAIRRMEAGTLTNAETEDVGRALMALEATVRDLRDQFALTPEDLNLDLGPLGRML